MWPQRGGTWDVTAVKRALAATGNLVLPSAATSKAGLNRHLRATAKARQVCRANASIPLERKTNFEAMPGRRLSGAIPSAYLTEAGASGGFFFFRSWLLARACIVAMVGQIRSFTAEDAAWETRASLWVGPKSTEVHRFAARTPLHLLSTLQSCGLDDPRFPILQFVR